MFLSYKGLVITDLLIAVEGVHILKWGGHQVGRDVPINEGEGFPRLQIAVGLRPIFIVTVAAALRPWSPSLLLSDTPLDGGQRLRSEGAEAVRSGRYKQLCHLVILLLQRAARGSAGAGSCNKNDTRSHDQTSENSWSLHLEVILVDRVKQETLHEWIRSNNMWFPNVLVSEGVTCSPP